MISSSFFSILEKKSQTASPFHHFTLTHNHENVLSRATPVAGRFGHICEQPGCMYDSLRGSSLDDIGPRHEGGRQARPIFRFPPDFLHLQSPGREPLRGSQSGDRIASSRSTVH
jgi:hypothetical protein